MILQIIQDALFSAIAAIGFAAISKPPRRAYLFCAAIAAAGHSLRFILMSETFAMHIVPATLIAASVIGVLAVFASPLSNIPAETYLFPALLPMIPGMYAYRAFGALALCIMGGEETLNHNFFLLVNNSLTCCCILLCMVTGATTPIFLFRKISFRATRNSD